MINFNKENVNILIYQDYIVVRGEEKNKNKGYKIIKSDFNDYKIQLTILEKMNFKQVNEYLVKNKIKFELVEFI